VIKRVAVVKLGVNNGSGDGGDCFGVEVWTDTDECCYPCALHARRAVKTRRRLRESVQLSAVVHGTMYRPKRLGGGTMWQTYCRRKDCLVPPTPVNYKEPMMAGAPAADNAPRPSIGVAVTKESSTTTGAQLATRPDNLSPLPPEHLSPEICPFRKLPPQTSASLVRVKV